MANGFVYVGSDDGGVYAFDAMTGQTLLWKFLTGGAVVSSPDVANGIVYVGSTDGALYALDALTGQSVTKDLTGGAIFSSPEVANGVVYVGSDDKFVYAFSAVPEPSTIGLLLVGVACVAAARRSRSGAHAHGRNQSSRNAD